jgi:hypothetical protein
MARIKIEDLEIQALSKDDLAKAVRVLSMSATSPSSSTLLSKPFSLSSKSIQSRFVGGGFDAASHRYT